MRKMLRSAAKSACSDFLHSKRLDAKSEIVRSQSRDLCTLLTNETASETVCVKSAIGTYTNDDYFSHTKSHTPSLFVCLRSIFPRQPRGLRSDTSPPWRHRNDRLRSRIDFSTNQGISWRLDKHNDLDKQWMWNRKMETKLCATLFYDSTSRIDQVPTQSV